MKATWIQCLQSWKASLTQSARAARRRTERRFSSLRPREVQVLEARLVLAADLDDQISEVSTLGLIADTMTQSGTIGSVADEAADVDMYATTVLSGEKVTIDIDHSTSDFNSVLRVFDSTGRQMAMNDNAAGPGESLGTEAFATVTFSSAGTYYIGVSGFGNTAYSATTGLSDRASSTGDYTVTIAPVDADDQPTEVTSLGTLISDLKPRASTIELPFDVDVYKFSVADGQTVGVDVDNASGSSLDSYLRVFKSDGTEIGTGAGHTPGPGETDGIEAYLTFTASGAGDYYVAVSNSANKTYDIGTGAGDVGTGTTGGYSVVITYLDGNDQMSEVDNDPSLNIASTFDLASVSGSITQLADVNVYSFTAYAKQKIAFDVDQTGNWNSYLRVFGSNGSQVASNDNAAAPGETIGNEPYLVYEFRSGGTYHVAVSSSGNGSYVLSTGLGDRLGTTTGDYTLTMTPLDIDDQTTEAVAMGELLSKADKSGVIDAGFDVDLYKFTGYAGQVVGVDLDLGSGSALDSYVRLFDSTGTELAANDDAAAPGESAGTESYLSFTLTADGIYYVGVSDKSNDGYDALSGLGDVNGSTSGSYALSLVSIDSDDELSEATDLGAIADDVSVPRTISINSDVDLLKFTAQAGQKIAIDVDNANGSTLNSMLRVFSSNGSQVASNDNAAAPGESASSESYLLLDVRMAGTYYVGLSGSGNSAYVTTTGLGDKAGSTGAATITLSPADVDDSISEAVSLGALTTTLNRTGAIENGLDVDVFSFTAYAGQTIGIDLDKTNGTLDSRLRLFDSTGTQVASNDNAAAPEETVGLDSYLTFDITSTGTYYVGVSATENDAYDATLGNGDKVGTTLGAYGLILTSIDADDQMTEAFDLGAATDSLSRSGTISLSTDVDLLKFTVAANQRLEFDVDQINGSTLNSYLRVFDSTGRQIASNDNAAGPGEALGDEAYLVFNFTAGGTYYVGLSNAGNRSYLATTGASDTASTTKATGEYSLSITIADLDDQISEATNMGTITSLQRRDGAVDTVRDVDIYKFTVSAGQHVGFDIDTSNGTLDSYIKVMSSDGTVLAFNDNDKATGESDSNDSYVEYTFTNAGTYFIAVSSTENTSYNATDGTGDTAGSVGGYTLIASTVPDGNGFQITVNFGGGLTDSQKAIFQQAADRWAQAIIGDLPDINLGNGDVIDDVRIDASGVSIDGPGQILGQAAPTQFRSDSSLPYAGFMQFDSADLAMMEANHTMFAVILHEMGHVLGIGTLWASKGLLTGAGGSNPRFTGAQATAAYNRIFNNTETSVPVENQGGGGTRDAHWRESTMPYEVMTGYISSRNYLTEITIGSLADLGYIVDLGAADTYVP